MPSIIEQLVARSAGLARETINPIFTDRKHAGEILAERLASEDPTNLVLFAILNGGVPVALSVSERLNLPVYTVPVKKVLMSEDPRFGMGAVTLSHTVMHEGLIEDLELEACHIERQTAAAQYELGETFNEFGPLASVSPQIDPDAILLLVDDGISTGSTILAAVKQLKELKPHSIIAAAPVMSRRGHERLEAEGIRTIATHISDEPAFLVDAFYKQFPQLTLTHVLGQL